MGARSRTFAWVVVIGVVVTSGALVEGILRIYAAVAETPLAEALRRDPYDVLVEPHGEAGYRPRPDRTIEYEWMGGTAHTNHVGFRGPPVGIPKPDGVSRIVLLGGSTTFGWGVDDDETIDAYMRALLEERYPDRDIEVVNLAFDGYDSYQLLERYRTDGARFDPDFVIVNTGVNDVRNAWYRGIVDGDRRTLLYLATLDQLRLEEERGGPTLWTRAKHWLYSARLPGWIRRELRISAIESMASELPPPELHWDALDYFERNVRRLIDLAVRSDSAVVLLSTPPSSLLSMYNSDHPIRADYWIRDAATTQMYRDSLDARLKGIVDGVAEAGRRVRYVPHGEFPKELFLDDAHLTPAGNRRMADDFVDALEPWIERDSSVDRGALERR